jgi:hypothetical protein
MSQESYSPGLAQGRRTDLGILERARFPMALEPADAMLYTPQQAGRTGGRTGVIRTLRYPIRYPCSADRRARIAPQTLPAAPLATVGMHTAGLAHPPLKLKRGMDDSHVLVSVTPLCSAVLPACNIFPGSRISLVFLSFSAHPLWSILSGTISDRWYLLIYSMLYILFTYTCLLPT